MVRPRMVYPNAPITEALCDIRVRPAAEITIEQIEAMALQLADTYKSTEDQFEVSTQFEVTDQTRDYASAVTQKKIGKRLRTEDGTGVVQAQLTGQSVSRLRPYKDWKALKLESQRVWEVYKTITKPAGVARLALRYINRIDIPGSDTISIEDYLRTTVQVGDEIKTPMSNFFAQIHIPRPAVSAMCIINTAALPPASRDVISILFDIDIFRVDKLPENDDQMWDIFDDLANAKNEIFESSITQKARELFK